MAIIEESGWAPWVSDGDVYLNDIYDFSTRFNWFDQASLNTSAFCQGIHAARNRHAMWVPWVKNLNAMKTNSRCSLGAATLLTSLQLQDRISFESVSCIRPVLRLTFGQGRITKIVILNVHLNSSYVANYGLDGLVRALSTFIQEGTPALIVGDMNIDLLANPQNPPNNKWRILNINAATQQSGGELDWGLLYDPNNHYANATAQLIAQFKTPTNPSDHSVLCYNIPLRLF